MRVVGSCVEKPHENIQKRGATKCVAVSPNGKPSLELSKSFLKF